MSEQYVISFNKDNCIQCHGCEVACRIWRNAETGVKWRRIATIWEGSYPDVKNYSVSIACMHCAEPPCIKACPEGAIRKRPEDGIVIVEKEKCTGCRACLDACPFDVPAFGEDGIMQKCDMCLDVIDYETQGPPCVGTCPTSALSFCKAAEQEKISMEESLKKLLPSGKSSCNLL